MKFSQQFQDFFNEIAFNYKNDYFINNPNEEKNTLTENEDVENLKNSLNSHSTNDELTDYNKEKFGYSLDTWKVKEWTINKKIRVYSSYFNDSLVYVYVYQQVKTINNNFNYNLVGQCSVKHYIKFYTKSKDNGVYLIGPNEYNPKSETLNISIALFYTINPKLFSPNWEKIAKKLF